MADVRLNIAGREYLVTCRDGEEGRLSALGDIVDGKAQEAGGSSSGLNESRQLLFAALLLADEVVDARPTKGMASGSTAMNDDADMLKFAKTLDKLAERLESVADKLEQ